MQFIDIDWIERLHSTAARMKLCNCTFQWPQYSQVFFAQYPVSFSVSTYLDGIYTSTKHLAAMSYSASRLIICSYINEGNEGALWRRRREQVNVRVDNGYIEVKKSPLADDTRRTRLMYMIVHVQVRARAHTHTPVPLRRFPSSLWSFHHLISSRLCSLTFLHLECPGHLKHRDAFQLW